ncbi:MAG: hypothetical protein ACEQR8_03280 [Cypionkella sp.]
MIEGQAITPALTKFELRGRFIDCFARIEDHLAATLERLILIEHCKKTPYLFGDKFELIRATASVDGVWQHPHHVAPILDQLDKYAKLRGLICHGVITETSLGEESAFSIRGPGQNYWEERKVITFSECSEMLRYLEALTGKLLKQSVKSWSKPQTL